MTWTPERRKAASKRLTELWRDPNWAARQRHKIATGFRGSRGHKPKQRNGTFALQTYVDKDIRNYVAHFAQTSDIPMSIVIERAIIQFLESQGYDV